MSACSCWAPEGCPNSSTDGTDCTGVAAWSGKLLYSEEFVLVVMCAKEY